MKHSFLWPLLILPVFLAVLFFAFPEYFTSATSYVRGEQVPKPIGDPAPSESSVVAELPPPLPPLDTVAYDKKLNDLANNPPPPERRESDRSEE